MDLGCVYFFTDEIFNEQEKPLRQLSPKKQKWLRKHRENYSQFLSGDWVTLEIRIKGNESARKNMTLLKSIVKLLQTSSKQRKAINLLTFGFLFCHDFAEEYFVSLRRLLTKRRRGLSKNLIYIPKWKSNQLMDWIAKSFYGNSGQRSRWRIFPISRSIAKVRNLNIAQQDWFFNVKSVTSLR